MTGYRNLLLVPQLAAAIAKQYRPINPRELAHRDGKFDRIEQRKAPLSLWARQ